MEWNVNLLDFLQKLTYNLVDYISDKDYMEFVRESLKFSSQALDNKSEISPDILYDRLENLDEYGILTFMELDKETDSLIWSCIANYFALICYHLYQQSGEKYLPQTIESVDKETLEAYVSSYLQLVAENQKLADQLSALDLELILNDPLVDNYFGDLLREIQMKY